METYLTELAPDRRYSVKLVQHDGRVIAVGDFSTMSSAHRWIDDRRKVAADIAAVKLVAHP